MQFPETDFCGYSVPHPYEPKMHVRIQTVNIPTATVLKKGFDVMENICDDLSVKFDDALIEFRSKK
jgi:DNA-directed RNA polymerase I and III subunit RPAC2